MVLRMVNCTSDHCPLQFWLLSVLKKKSHRSKFSKTTKTKIGKQNYSIFKSLEKNRGFFRVFLAGLIPNDPDWLQLMILLSLMVPSILALLESFVNIPTSILISDNVKFDRVTDDSRVFNSLLWLVLCVREQNINSYV